MRKEYNLRNGRPNPYARRLGAAGARTQRPVFWKPSTWCASMRWPRHSLGREQSAPPRAAAAQSDTTSPTQDEPPGCPRAPQARPGIGDAGSTITPRLWAGHEHVTWAVRTQPL